MARPVVVNFIGDATKLNRTIGQVDNKVGGLKKTIGALAGLGIGTALFAGLKSTINAAKESQAVSRETSTRIKEMGNVAGISAEGVGKLATAISNKTGKDDEAVQSGANMLLTFKNIRNEVGAGNDIFNQATLVATNMAAKFGGDASKSAVQLGKALDNPIKGVAALSKIGVTFDEGQKKQIATMVKAGDIMGAQKIILGEVGKQTAGAAAASTTGWDKFLVKIGNIQEDIGTKLLPVIDDLATKLMKGIDFVGKNSTAFKILGSVIVGVIGFILTMNVVTKVTTAVQTGAKAATLAWTIAQKALNLAMRMNPIGIVITVVMLLVAAIITAYKNSETFRRVVKTVFDFIRDKVATVVNFIIGMFRAWLNMGFTVVEGILRVFGKLPGPMGAPFRKAADAVRDAKKTVNEQIDKIQTKVNSLRGKDIPIKASLGLKFSPSFSQKDWVNVRLAAGRMAQGGRLPGFGGGDVLPILAEPGEAVVDKYRTKKYASVLAAMGVPGFQRGGILGAIDSESTAINKVQAHGVAARLDKGITKIMSVWGSGGGSASIKAFIKAADSLRYVYGAAGPSAFDCSGIVSAVLGKMLGMRGAGSGLRLFTTATIGAGMYGLRTGLGGVLQIGVTPGKGHMAARYGGLGFEAESSRTGIKIGAAASRPESFARHFYHMRKGGLIDFDRFNIGGDKDALRIMTMDQGGWLKPGLNLTYNGTGRRERVSPPSGGDVHIHYHGPVYGDKRAIARAVREDLKNQATREGNKALLAVLR